MEAVGNPIAKPGLSGHPRSDTGRGVPRPLFARRDILFFLIFLGLLLTLFKDLVFFDRTFFARDMTVIETPARKLCIELLKQGDFAPWTDAYGNGQPFLANPKNAVFYPGGLLYALLPFFAAFKLHFLLHFLIGWAGLYYLGKALSLGEEAAFLGATLFFFGGITLSCVEFYNHIAALAWMPWVLLAVFRFPRGFLRPTLRLSWLWSLMILAGTPFLLLITGITAGLRSLLERKHRARRLGVLAVSVGIALLITAVQLIPAAEVLKGSVRGAGASSTWALQPFQVFNFVFPNVLGNDRTPGRFDYWGGFLFDKGYPLFYSLYLGGGFLVLLILGMRGPFDIRHRTFFGALLVFFVLALGSRLGIFQFWKDFPPFSLIRYPVKYMLGVVLAVCMLAAMAFDSIYRSGRPVRRSASKLAAGWGVGLVLFLALRSSVVSALSELLGIRDSAKQAALARSLLWGVVSLLIFTLVVMASPRFRPGLRRHAGRLFILLVVAELIGFNRFINPTIPTSFFDDPDFVRGASRPVTVYRDTPMSFYYQGKIDSLAGYHEYMRQTGMPFAGIAGSLRHPFGNDFYNLSDPGFSVLRALAKRDYGLRVKLLAAVGCDWHIGHHRIPGLPIDMRMIEGYRTYFQRVTKSSPSAWLSFRTVFAESREDRRNVFFDRFFDPFRAAIVDPADAPFLTPVREARGEVIPLEEAPARGAWQVKNSHPALLVFQGNAREGWQATVDGVPAEVIPVNLFSRGLLLEAGDHRVETRYIPPGFRLGLWISLISVALFIFYWGSLLLRYSAKPPARSNSLP